MSQPPRRSSARQKNVPAASVGADMLPNPLKSTSAITSGSGQIKFKLTIPAQQPDAGVTEGDKINGPAPPENQPQPKKRTRAPSIPAQDLPVDTPSKPPAKRARGKGAQKTNDLVDLQEDVSPKNTPRISQIPAQPKPPLPPRSPAPFCKARPAVPGGPNMPRPRRTSEEVQKAALAKAEVDAEIARLLEKRILLAAQEEMNDREAEQAEDLAAP
ncbi:hypothetical protein JAAARDRAFT_200349 [Jaapia argillacea MUCL 33604]|uniref:Uncharacterized protein n=1 Tax=Jaapia argillacea MUCL 33604 TaxID=933084 RepID=A0A067PG86_9AGAM|nr:hypothetical protein JAAARDRAFT_200349 [Jaapia argillacea MUCL 33604]